MKPFDLEAAMRGEPVVCRDGEPAKFIAYFPDAPPPSRVVFLRQGSVFDAYENGQIGNKRQSADLLMGVMKKTVWVNFSPGGKAYYYQTEELANKSRMTKRIGNRAYPVEIEE